MHIHFGAGRRLRKLGLAGALAIAAAGALPWRVAVASGRSMEPTLRSGQPFAYERWDPALHHARRGDVIVVRVDGILCVKRVLAVGGDRFWTLNRNRLGLASAFILPVNVSAAPWTRRFRNLTAHRVSVPAGHVFVVGDSSFSCDSRHYGPVPERHVVGRVLLGKDDPNSSLSLVTWSGPPPLPGRSRS